MTGSHPGHFLHLHLALAALLACSFLSSGLMAERRALVASFAFFAEEAAFFAEVRFPRATAAGFFATGKV